MNEKKNPTLREGIASIQISPDSGGSGTWNSMLPSTWQAVHRLPEEWKRQTEVWGRDAELSVILGEPW